MTVTNKTPNGAEIFETLTTFSPDSLKQGYEKFSENLTAMAQVQNDYTQAIFSSAAIVAKGVEKLTTEQNEFVRTVFEDTVANAKAASASKTLQEAAELNSEFLRDATEKNLGQYSKITELYAGISKEASEPLSSRYSELVEKIQSYRP